MLTDQDRIAIVRYRIETAHKTLDEVQTHIDNGFYNTAVNRMYYACYYITSALLIANKLTSKSHDGVRLLFSLHFVKTGLVSRKFGRFYSTLFDERSSGDYDDLFDHDLSTCEELYPQAKEFVETIESLIENTTEPEDETKPNE